MVENNLAHDISELHLEINSHLAMTAVELRRLKGNLAIALAVLKRRTVENGATGDEMKAVVDLMRGIEASHGLLPKLVGAFLDRYQFRRIDRLIAATVGALRSYSESLKKANGLFGTEGLATTYEELAVAVGNVLACCDKTVKAGELCLSSDADPVIH